VYLDLFDELRLNKRLVKIAGFEVAAYWAELQSILKQVVKKKTADERGFFNLDRNFVEQETTLSVTKQLKCDDLLTRAGVLLKDENDPNRLAISVSAMVEYITDEDVTKLGKKSTKSTQAETKEAKVAGIKATMKKAILEPDLRVRAAYERWIDGMVDAANCRFTKAVVQLFEQTVSKYTSDADTKISIIEIATINSYRDAQWAINKLNSKYTKPTNPAIQLPEQRIATAVSEDIFF
jgi:hypothetical protein